jgi:hypothetical protein
MIAQTLEMSLASLVGFDEKVLFDNCKAEGTYAANCVHYTIHETSKLHEKVHQEKDARIAFLEKQLQSNNQTHEKQVASLERQLDEKQLIINKLLGK